MKKLLVISALATTVFLTGCATEQNIPLADNFWQHSKQKVAIAKTTAPTPQLYQTGNEGLLDVAINNAVNHKLNNYLSHADTSWYPALPANFAQGLKQRHMSASLLDSELNPDQDNYKNLVGRIDSDTLLVIKLQALGVKRNYYSFIPTGAPQAFCQLKGELINVNTNKVLWRYKASISEAIQGPWDQPPNYPNMTKAINVAVNSARQELLDSFFSGH